MCGVAQPRVWCRIVLNKNQALVIVDIECVVLAESGIVCKWTE